MAAAECASARPIQRSRNASSQAFTAGSKAEAAGEMIAPVAGAGQLHARGAARRPADHHVVGQLGMELDAVGAGADADRLVGIGLAGGQQLGAARQVEALAVPLIDLARPFRHQLAADLGGRKVIIADLDEAVVMAVDAGAEIARQHLRAEADAEERLFLAQRHVEPVGLAGDEGIGVVGAHRPAEDDGTGVAFQRLGQQLAEARPADVEGKAPAHQLLPDAAGRRGFLMQDDENLGPVGQLFGIQDHGTRLYCNAIRRREVSTVRPRPRHRRSLSRPRRRPCGAGPAGRARKCRAVRRRARSCCPRIRGRCRRHRRAPTSSR